MKAKPGLVPDCDLHGEPMFRDEVPAPLLGLPGSRDIIVWRCGHPECDRYFEGGVGYRHFPPSAGTRTPRCPRDRAFLVAQHHLGRYLCPVDRCDNTLEWKGSSTLAPQIEQNEPELATKG